VITLRTPLVVTGTFLTAFSNAHMYGAVMCVVAAWAEAGVLGRAISWTLTLAGDLGFTSSSAIFAALQAAYDSRTQPEQHAVAPYQFMLLLLVCNTLVQAALLRTSAAAGFSPPKLHGGGDMGGDRGTSTAVAASPPPLLPQSSKLHRAAVSASTKADGQPVLVAGEHPLDHVALRAAVCVLLSHGRVWAFCLVAGCLYTGAAGLIAFISSFGVHALGMTDHHATLLITCTGVGLIIGALLVGPAKDLLSSNTVHWATVAIVGVHALAHAVVLAHLGAGATQSLASAMPYICVAMGAAISWLSAVGAVFAVRFAGPIHTATFCGLTDLCAFTMTAPYQLVASHLIDERAFITYWGVTSSFLVVGMISLVVLLRVEEGLPPHARPP